jgi:hypothetical protein
MVGGPMALREDELGEDVKRDLVEAFRRWKQ